MGKSGGREWVESEGAVVRGEFKRGPSLLVRGASGEFNTGGDGGASERRKRGTEGERPGRGGGESTKVRAWRRKLVLAKPSHFKGHSVK